MRLYLRTIAVIDSGLESSLVAQFTTGRNFICANSRYEESETNAMKMFVFLFNAAMFLSSAIISLRTFINIFYVVSYAPGCNLLATVVTVHLLSYFT